MNIEDLKNNWKELHDQGLNPHDRSDINAIVSQGTSQLVAEINKKLFNSMALTAIAAIISTVAIIFFYLVYDPAQHPWINVSKLIPIQLLAATIFLLLFLATWVEYKLVNRKFSSASVSSFITNVLTGFRRYFWLFTAIITLLLFAVYFVEINYFVNPDSQWESVAIIGVAVLLTAISWVVVRQYYKKAFGAYFTDMQSYLDELEK